MIIEKSPRRSMVRSKIDAAERLALRALKATRRAIDQLEHEGVGAPASAHSLADLARFGGHDIRRNVREIEHVLGAQLSAREAGRRVARALAHIRIIIGPTSP